MTGTKKAWDVLSYLLTRISTSLRIKTNVRSFPVDELIDREKNGLVFNRVNK